MVRRFVALVVAVVATLALATMPARPAAATANRDRDVVEREFVGRINALRASKGLRALAVDGRLTDVARDWAARMSRAGRISHRADLAAVAPDPAWVKIGENVGVGGTVRSLHDAFVASHAHYVNLVDDAWHYVGIGVVFEGDTIYVAQNFMQVEEAAASAHTSHAPALAAAPVALPVEHGTERMCGGTACLPPPRLVSRR
jgi:uncharacterized protein YkwD